ncbi:hypothetical protein [Bradyrhizobium sp. BWA-3-5]|uniref:hypothetical protein n=1 Tax=Bradyrhizobium sp. BWA-3-5 TaxID=3080013 RepID=UPI00293E17E9|nr:hypothetical protein [Bradyrhizobium sp. BWA-3-5]WOH66180.1 hypothetical protein RX331_37660 [Bradyrhizobium sp. BWA-3-5]
MIISALRVPLCLYLLWTCSLSTPSAASDKDLAAPSCDLRLEGEIAEGSLKRLQVDYAAANKKFAAIPKKPTESVTFAPTLCLSSPGRNLQEALRIIEWLRETTFITTFVPQNARCLSACALIFMFGNFNEGHGIIGPRRKLHHLGQLGFHSPHIAPLIDAKDPVLSARAYRSGIKAIGELLEKDSDDIFFPKTLLVEALRKEPEEFMFVDTVQRAASWGIDVVGFDPPKQLTARMLEAACLNKARPDQFKGARGMTRWWGAGDSPTGQREELTASAATIMLRGGQHRAVFSKFGDEDAFVCVVDVYSKQGGDLAIDINFGESARDKRVPKPRRVNAEYDGNSPLWYTFTGSVRLQDLPKKIEKR